MPERRFAVCAFFRNEARYLPEWLSYHRAIGFEHFVLYDNNSDDGGKDVIRASPFADRVTLINWPQAGAKLAAYRHFSDIFAPAFEWAAFLDVSEFLLPMSDETLPKTLERYQAASAVWVNWRVFGPGAWSEPPSGLVIESYDLRAPDESPLNRFAKPLVRCEDLLDVSDTEWRFQFKGGVVNPRGEPVENAPLQPAACHERLVIHRYHTRSRTEWQITVRSGVLVPSDPGPAPTEDLAEQLAALCQVRDGAIRVFAPRIRAALGMPEPTPSVPPQGALVADPVSSPVCAILADGRAMVVRDTSLPEEAWLAALRGDAATLIDPDFLLDEYGRICRFGTGDEAKEACLAALMARAAGERR